MTKAEIKVIKIADIKIENIKIAAPRPNKKGGKSIYINYDYEDGRGLKPLRIQMPKMKIPFGISAFVQDRKDDNTPTEYSTDNLEFSLGERENIIKKLEEIDNLVFNTALEKSIEYFNQKRTKDVLEAFFTRTVKYNKDKEGNIINNYPPRIKTKLYKGEQGKYSVDVFDSNKQKVKMDIYNYDTVLPRGCDAVCLLECAGIWVVSGKFGVTWRPKQMLVYKADNSLDGFAFIPDEDVEETEEYEKKSEPVEYENKSEPEEEQEQETEEVEETEETEEVEETEPEEDPLEQATEEVKSKSKGRAKATTTPKRGKNA